MRLRSIREAAKLVKAEDNESGVNLNCIRNLIRNGKVHYVKTGRKVLLDLDDLFNYLSGRDNHN